MKEGDQARRLAFAQKVCDLSDQQLGNMAFSDEAYFCLDGQHSEHQEIRDSW